MSVASEAAHRKQLAWCDLYCEMHRIASTLLAVCPQGMYSAQLAAIKRVEAKANEEAKR